MGYLFFILFVGLFLYAVNRFSFFKIEGWSKKPLYFALGFKMLAALVLVFIYTYYYTDRTTADIYRYFDDAAYLFEQTKDQLGLRWKLILGIQDATQHQSLIAGTQYWDSKKEVFFNDNRTMIRIHLLLYHISNGFFQLHNLFFVVLSFIGSMGIFRFFSHFSKLPTSLVFCLSFLIPSFVFWTSAPLKESFLVFGLGILLFGLLALTKRKWLQAMLLLATSLFCMLSLKVYILIALLPATLFFISTFKFNSLIPKFIGIHIIILLFSLFFISDISQILAEKQSEFKELALISQAKSSIPLSSFSTPQELFLNIPQAIFNVMIRPAWPANWSPFSLMASVEHLLYLLLLLSNLVYFKKPKPQEVRTALFCLSFVLLSSIIIGLTTPILGSIVRYKTPFLPFYLFLLFTFTNLRKLRKRLPFL